MVAAAMNQAAELGFEMVDGDVVRGGVRWITKFGKFIDPNHLLLPLRKTGSYRESRQHGIHDGNLCGM